jgi:hypothetical protein
LNGATGEAAYERKEVVEGTLHDALGVLVVLDVGESDTVMAVVEEALDKQRTYICSSPAE